MHYFTSQCQQGIQPEKFHEDELIFGIRYPVTGIEPAFS